MDSCPKELEPYRKAHELKMREMDYLQYMWWGNYGISAVFFAVDKSLKGKTSKAMYVEKALLSESIENTGKYKESAEEIAIFEMKQRINILRQQGLPESPD